MYPPNPIPPGQRRAGGVVCLHARIVLNGGKDFVHLRSYRVHVPVGGEPDAGLVIHQVILQAAAEALPTCPPYAPSTRSAYSRRRRASMVGLLTMNALLEERMPCRHRASIGRAGLRAVFRDQKEITLIGCAKFRTQPISGCHHRIGARRLVRLDEGVGPLSRPSSYPDALEEPIARGCRHSGANYIE